MPRYSRTFVQTRFENAMKAAGLPYCKQNEDTKGSYALDYYPYGGGYRIVMNAHGGGESLPFGGVRYKPSSFVDVLGVIRDTAALVRANQEA